MKQALNTGKKKYRKIIEEDMKVLQEKISGKSVYRQVTRVYRRIPKHRKLQYSVE